MPQANDLIGPYQLIRKLGAGGFGEVWLAQDFSISPPREVAVKTPLKSEIDLDALLQEATLWARATGHPNVLEFLAARVFDGQVVLVSEYAPGGSLRDWLGRHGGRAASVEAAGEMTLGILAGLEHLPSRIIIHRDIKPENVLLLGATPRLGDFGVSRVLKYTSKSVITAGTPPYMAPEAFNRKRNQQTDLWAVGVMLYQMLSGRLPFNGADLAELYGAILNEDPEPLPTAVPDWLRRVVAKALTKEPERRYKTATEMISVLAPRPLRIEEISATAPSSATMIDESPLKVEPNIIEPQPPKPEPTVISLQPHKPEPIVSESTSQPKSDRQGQLPKLVKWGAGLVAVFIALVIYQKSCTPPSPPKTPDLFTENLNGVKLEMLRVPGGTFLMGSPKSEEGRNEDEGPQRQVNVPDFYIGKYEITQSQWTAVMGANNNPSSCKGDDRPVEQVTWNDAKAFCEKLSGMTNKTYRLPSEAEWEYACRGRTTGAYAGNLDAMAWYSDNSDSKTHPVGQKLANAFGLYDLHGNVWEWCEDVYHDSYGGQHGNPPADGSAWLEGEDSSYRVIRCGAWGNESGVNRSASRKAEERNERFHKYGIRVAISGGTP